MLFTFPHQPRARGAAGKIMYGHHIDPEFGAQALIKVAKEGRNLKCSPLKTEFLKGCDEAERGEVITDCCKTWVERDSWKKGHSVSEIDFEL